MPFLYSFLHKSREIAMILSLILWVHDAWAIAHVHTTHARMRTVFINGET